MRIKCRRYNPNPMLISLDATIKIGKSRKIYHKDVNL